MDTLIKAIKAFDIVTVRTLLQTEQYDGPEINAVLAMAKTEGLDYLAKEGIKRIEVCLVLKFGWSAQYTKPELQQLLVGLMEELSEDCYAAGWYNNIEFQLWDLLHDRCDELTTKLWHKRSDMEAVQDLKRLKDITHSWATWDETAGEPVPIVLENWILLANKFPQGI